MDQNHARTLPVHSYRITNIVQFKKLLQSNKFVHPELWAPIMTERKLALLLKFEDGSLMPLLVHSCIKGSLLMNELITRLADRIDPEYQYTRQELRALRSADWNRIVKQRIP